MTQANNIRQARFKPNLKQYEMWNILNDDSTNICVYGGSAGGGKSFLGCMWLLSMALSMPNTRYVIGRKQLNELKESTIVTFTKIVNDNDLWSEFVLNGKSGLVGGDNAIDFKNGSRIMLKNLDLDPSGELIGLGSMEISASFVDECAEVEYEAIRKLLERTRWDLDKWGKIPKVLVVSNPCNNWLKREVYDKYKRGALPDHIRYVPATMKDNAANLPKSYVDSMSLAILGPRKYAQMVEGSWDFYEGQYDLFKAEDLYDCFSFSSGAEPCNQQYISVDCAGAGKDSTVLCRWSGFTLTEIKKERLLTAPDIVSQIKSWCSSYNIPATNVIIDVGANTNGPQDWLPHCVKFVANARPFDEDQGQTYGMLKDQLIFKFSQYVAKKSMRITDKAYMDEIIAQAIEHKIASSEDSKLRVTKKDIIKQKLSGKSPDCFDSIYMRFWWCYGNRDSGSFTWKKGESPAFGSERRSRRSHNGGGFIS